MTKQAVAESSDQRRHSLRIDEHRIEREPAVGVESGLQTEVTAARGQRGE
jgi:hypothetical protein